MLGDVIQHGELRRSRIARVARNGDSSVVCGIIQTGLNGLSSDLVHTETGFVSHHRTAIEAEFIPFFYLLACPVGSEFGVLLLQRLGNLGMRDFFVDPLVEAYSQVAPNHRLRVNRLVPADLARQVLDEAVIKSIRLIRYNDLDEASVSLGEGYDESTKSIEMVYRAHRNGMLPKAANIFAALRGQKALPEIFSVENFEYDSVKIEVEINGHRRLIDLGRPTVMTPNVDVSDDMEIEDTGYPSWESSIEMFGAFAQDSLLEDGIDTELDLEMVEDEEAAPLPEEV